MEIMIPSITGGAICRAVTTPAAGQPELAPGPDEGGAEAEVSAGKVRGIFGDEVEFELPGLAGGVEELDEDAAAGLDGEGGGLGHGVYSSKE